MSYEVERDVTGELATYCSSLRLADVPSPIAHAAKLLLLDSLGCIIAATGTPVAPVARASTTMFGSGDEATVAGRSGRGSLAAAIYANGRLANCMDLDETFPVGHHFGVGAVVAALALAEAHQRSGKDVLLALVAGYELGGRIASANGAPMYVEDGRVTGYPDLYGFSGSVAFAAAAAGIKLFDLDPAVARQALGLAGSNTPVPVMSKWSEAVDLPDCKYCDAGWCSLAGVFAVQAARLGMTGFDNILDGNRGLIRMLGTETFDRQSLVGGLGERWMLADLTYKPWPTCRWTHQPLTALAKALRQEPVDWRQVRRITIGTNLLLCTPRFRNAQPRTFCSRQFSIPHMVTMAVLGIPPGPQWLDERQDADPRVQPLRNKIVVEHWDRGDAFAHDIVHGQVRRMPARVTIELEGGRSVSADTEFALGDPWDPATAYDDAAVIDKFRVVTGLDAGAVDRIVDAALALESQPDVAVFAEAMARGAARKSR
jgi:2-methylcitrate dehydratase PrpD